MGSGTSPRLVGVPRQPRRRNLVAVGGQPCLRMQRRCYGSAMGWFRSWRGGGRLPNRSPAGEKNLAPKARGGRPATGGGSFAPAGGGGCGGGGVGRARPPPA